jgi:hypothetical protein
MSTVPPGIRPPSDNRLVELLEYLEGELGDGFNRFVDEELRRVRIQITPAARLMLVLPLYELGARPWLRGPNLESFGDSIRQLLETMAESPAAADMVPETIRRAPLPERSALSVIKAYWSRFCNIPPFCGEK